MSSDIASTKKRQTPMMSKPPLMSVDEKKSFKVPHPPPPSNSDKSRDSKSSNTSTTAPPENKTTTYNPISLIQNEWNATSSIGGKVCLVLFNTFVLGKLAWAIKDIISPTIGCECFIRGLSPYANEVVTMLTRGLAVLSIGYYTLAGYIGSNVISNVTFAFVINAAYGWVIFITNPIAEISNAPSCTDEVDRLILVTQIFFWTSLMAVNFAVVEYWSKKW